MGGNGFRSPAGDKGEPKLKLTGDDAPSLAKSFSERGGKGLPGVITAIDLGNFVSDEHTWGNDEGYRAPKFMEVTIQFSPLHDLPPGIDSSGHLTAASYGDGGSRAYNKGKFRTE